MKYAGPIIALFALVTGTALLAGCPQQQPEAPSPTPPPPPSDDQQPSDTDSSKGWPRTFTDAMGEKVTLQEPPERVISLSTGFTETIFAMDVGDRLVGRTSFAEYPPEAREVKSVGGMINPSLEAIVGQEPDLVLTVRGTPADVIASIRRAGIPVIAHDPRTIDDVLTSIRDLGRYLGVEEDANRLAEDLRERVEAVEARGQAIATSQGRPSVLFTIQADPVFVAGEGSFVDDMIHRAGGINAATLIEGQNGGQWPSLSLEAVVELSPDIIVTSMETGEGEPIDGEKKLSGLSGWKDLRAVEDGRVYTIDPDLSARAGPRLIDALEQMADIIEDAVGGGEPGDG